MVTLSVTTGEQFTLITGNKSVVCSLKPLVSLVSAVKC